MATIGTLAVKLISQTASFEKGLNKGVESLNKLQSKVTQVGTSVASMAGKFGALLGLGSIAGGLGLGIKLAADAEQSQIAFTTMLGDAEKARQVLSELSAFAAATPFEMPELRQAGQSLLAFGTPAEDLIPTLRALGDVSAGIGAPLNDIAEIYGKARTQGTLFAEDINQLTGRGIPIIQELAKQLGVAEGQVKKLVSEGKVNFGHLQQAFADMTAEGGKFAGLMEAQSGSLAGMWSTLKDNVGLALRDIAATVIETFGFKNAIGGLNGFVEQVGSQMQAALTVAAPVIKQIISTVVGGFQSIVDFMRPIGQAWLETVFSQLTAIWQVAQEVWGSIVDVWNQAMAAIGVSSGTMGSVRDTIVAALVTIEYGWQNWRAVLTLALTSVELGIVRFGNQVAYVFGTVIPEVVQWGVNNWRELLTDMVNIAMTVFENLGKNVINAMTEIWEFIRSGGSQGLEFTWTPLTEGFRSALKELPQIAQREIGGLESQLMGDVTALSQQLSEGFAEFSQRRMDEIFGLQGTSAGGAAGPQIPDRTLQQISQDQRQNQGPDMAALTKDADRFKKAIETPTDKFIREMNKIDELQRANLLTEKQSDLARQKVFQDAQKQVKLPEMTAGKALEAGSAEALSAISRRGTQRDKTEENTKVTAEKMVELVEIMREKFGQGTELTLGELS